MSDGHLTEGQRSYFETLRKLDHDGRLERHIVAAIADLDPNRPPRAPRVSWWRAFWRGLRRGVRRGFGIR